MQPEILKKTQCAAKRTRMENVLLPCKSCPSQHKSTLAALGHTRISKNASKRNMNTSTHLLTCHSHTENWGKESAGESDYSATVTITATTWTNQWPTCFNANRACFISNLSHVFDNTTLFGHLSKTDWLFSRLRGWSSNFFDPMVRFRPSVAYEHAQNTL